MITYLLNHFFLKNKLANVRPMKKRQIGRLKKIVGLPPDIKRDLRRDISNFEPNIKAMTRAGREKSNFLMRYPRIPKKTINPVSKTLVLIA